MLGCLWSSFSNAQVVFFPYRCYSVFLRVEVSLLTRGGRQSRQSGKRRPLARQAERNDTDIVTQKLESWGRKARGWSKLQSTETILKQTITINAETTVKAAKGSEWFDLFDLKLCIIYFSASPINILTTATQGRRFYWAIRLQSITEGSQGRNLEVGTEAETREVQSLLAYFPWLA